MEKVLKSLTILLLALLTPHCLAADANDVVIQEGSVDAARTGYFKNLAVDTNLIYADSNVGRVGIGTTSPGTKLDVKGGVNSYNPVSDMGAFFVHDYSNDSYRTAFLIGNDVWLATAASDGASSSYGRVIIKHTTGNVGIGTENPSCKLDVEGPVQATQFITGDIFFQKDGRKLWRMFEDEKGLYVENLNSGKVYNIVMQGKEKNNAVALEKKVRNLQAENETLKERIDVLEKTMQRLAKVKKVQQ